MGSRRDTGRRVGWWKRQHYARSLVKFCTHRWRGRRVGALISAVISPSGTMRRFRSTLRIGATAKSSFTPGEIVLGTVLREDCTADPLDPLWMRDDCYGLNWIRAG